MNFIKTCVSRPVLVTMIMAGLSGIGLFCYYQLPRELFPKVEFPMVTVVTSYQGAGPEEIEQLITKKLEDQISTVEGIKHLYGTSMQGLSILVAEFYLETNVDVAAADVRDKVNIVRPLLPEMADDPVVQKFDFNAQPIMQLAVSAPRPLKEVFHTADQRIKDRISTVPGVASVDVIGGQEREIHILTDQQRLRAHGLSIMNVVMAVAAANLDTPGGYIRQNSREYNIRLCGKFTDLDQIRNMRIMLPDGSDIRLAEAAQVQDAFKDVRDTVRADGRTCVGMSVKKRSDGNTVAIDEKVKQEIKNLKRILPPDYEIIIQEETASWIVSSIEEVFSNIRVGIVLTAIVLIIFLHTFRSMLIVALSMPISLLGTFIIMFMSGFTLNMMSLMGLAMSIGVLVDNAILVLENIFRYIDMGHSPKDAAIEGTSEIAVAVSSTTLTNIVIFVPIAFMGGIVGQFFRDFGLTATIATIVSLVISFTLVPMMAARLSTNMTVGRKSYIVRKFDELGKKFDVGLEKFKASYGRSLEWSLGHRTLIMVLTLVIFAGSIMLAGFIGGEFITNMDQGKFIVYVEMPTGTRLEETDLAIKNIEDLLMDRGILPELVSTYASIGRVLGGEIGGGSQAVNIAQVSVTIVPKDKRRQSTEQIMNRLRPAIAARNIPGARIKLMESHGGGGSEAPIQMQITGDNLSNIEKFMQSAVEIISNHELVPGAVDVDTNYRLGQPEIRIIPDRTKCRDALVDVKYLSDVIAASFEGLIVSEYRQGAYNYDIRVKNSRKYRRDITDVGKLTIMNARGELIPLPQIAAVETTTGPAQLFRKDRQSQITVSCNVSGSSPAEVATAIRRQTEPLLEKYPDCKIFFAGDIEMMEESFGRLYVALIMAVCLTYMLLASLLESFIQPLIIMFSLPLSLIGVFWGLFLMGGTFSIFSIMSVIMLVGLVVNSGIVVVDYTNVLRRQNKPVHQALIEACTTRLRPILMANLTTMMALIPLAMGLGWGGEMRAPMAMVQIGGLFAGGGLSLLVVPVIYAILDDLKEYAAGLFRHH